MIEKLKQMEKTHKVDIQDLESEAILSPEDTLQMERHKQARKAYKSLSRCKHIDEFHDVVFEIEGTYVKAYSIVLSARCDYFKGMF